MATDTGPCMATAATSAASLGGMSTKPDGLASATDAHSAMRHAPRADVVPLVYG